MIRHFLFLLQGILMCTAAAQSTAVPDGTNAPLSERRVAYEIEAVLDPAAKTVTGKQTLVWRNPGATPVSELQFHLYLNGFRDDYSSYMQESGGRFRGVHASDSERGSIVVTRLTVDPEGVPGNGRDIDPVELTDRMVFIQPDDGNPYDETVLSVTLPVAILPGHSATLRFDFESTLPRVFARTGWEETASGNLFFLVGQWFPKIGVYEVPGQRYVPANAPEGRWNTHQFHANSEFYADFGTYRVTIDVPSHYVVGATGDLVSEERLGDRKRIAFEAEDVHDFAWTASPDFRVHRDNWKHVAITALMLPEHERYVHRMVDATKLAMDRMDSWVGPYPYRTLTVVDALGGAVGMEYPTLITGWTSPFTPRWIRAPIEDTVIHEYIHQYFYGIIANNEFEEAWLDEGFTSYFEGRVMDDVYGPGSGTRFGGVEIDVSDSHRLTYTRFQPGRGRIYDIPWEQSGGTYARTAYYKTAVVLSTLEHHIGSQQMLEVFRTYYARWKFGHPTTRDFIGIVEQVTDEDLSWFFDQFVYGTAVVDYRVDRIWNQALQIDDSTVVYESEIVVERASDGVYPQTIRVHFADGTYSDFDWDGTDDWHTVSTSGPARVVMAEVDPDDQVWLDVDRLNNRMSVSPQDQFAREVQLTVIAVLQHLFLLFTGPF